MNRKSILLMLILTMASGCAVNKMDAQLYPDKTLKGRDSYYVVREEEDDRGIEKLIADKLVAVGKTASSGEADAVPEGVDVLVTYIDKWMWDITMYMIELTVIMREPVSEFPIAKGYSMHTSLTRKSPEKMVDEVVINIFNQE